MARQDGRAENNGLRQRKECFSEALAREPRGAAEQMLATSALGLGGFRQSVQVQMSHSLGKCSDASRVHRGMTERLFSSA